MLSPSTPFTPLQQLIEETTLSYTALAEQYGIRLQVLQDLASYAHLAGDIDRQKALLALVLPGTIRYARASQITLTTRQLLQSAHEVLVEFSVIDDGPARGEAPAFSYFRTLAQARRLIEDLGGKSEVMALPGVSKTLKFIIRYRRQAPVLPPPPAYRLQGKRILLAEDNEVNAHTVAAILEGYGATVDLAANGRAAVDRFAAEGDAYDLMLLDLDMPQMDGLEAAHYLRKQLGCTVPMIGMGMKEGAPGALPGQEGAAAMDGERAGEREACFAVGMNAYIRKPFTVEGLLDTLGGLLRAARIESA